MSAIFCYDANGNMTQKIAGSTTNYAYDAENRMVSVSGAASATFVYDGDGNRVKGVVGGVTTTYIGNYFEWSGSTSTMKKYYYAGGTRVAERKGTTLYWLLSDHLGSTSITATSSGSKTAEVRYKAWGETRYTYGTTQTTIRYTGQREESSLGLYWYASRWYSPGLGRFVSPDSIIPQPGNPQAWDRYAYTYSNPVRNVDPSGHRACEWDGDGNCVRDPDWEPGEIATPEKVTTPTLTEKILQGDTAALVELLIPSHVGIRLQVEISIDIIIGLSGSVGVNLVYNRNSDELAGNVDWSFEPGLGIGAGASGTGGILIGWGSSSVKDVTQGYSVIVSGTAAAEGAVAAAVTAPIDQNRLHFDPYSGQVPATLYVGGGGGGGYAGIGGGINGPTGIYTDLTTFLPWHWNK